MTDFSFLSHSPSSLSLPPIQPPQDITSQPPPMHPSNLPPLIILDDYSINHTLQGTPTEDYPKYPAPVESPSISTLSPHHYHHSPVSNSDSDMHNPPSSGVPSETSSAVVSESDIPSAVASDSGLLLLPITKSSGPKKQTGIHRFFQVLSEDEIQAAQAK